jgi:uncharacterized membrane protein
MNHTSPDEASSKLSAGLACLAIFFIVGGLLHFIFPELYLRIMPPFLPWPRLLVEISGVAEIAGGFGLLLNKFRRAAAHSLAILLIAVFPANVYMAVVHVPFHGFMGESWAQWLRLPLQIPIFLCTLHYGRRTESEAKTAL